MTERKIYSRHFFNRKHATLWKGDPASHGTLYRTVVLTSPDSDSTAGQFQVLALEGVGGGVINGRFAGSEGESQVLIDLDCCGLDEAVIKFAALVKESESKGFTQCNTVLVDLGFTR